MAFIALPGLPFNKACLVATAPRRDTAGMESRMASVAVSLLLEWRSLRGHSLRHGDSRRRNSPCRNSRRRDCHHGRAALWGGILPLRSTAWRSLGENTPAWRRTLAQTGLLAYSSPRASEHDSRVFALERGWNTTRTDRQRCGGKTSCPWTREFTLVSSPP